MRCAEGHRQQRVPLESRFVFVTHSQTGEYEGLEKTDDGKCIVWFRDFLTGRFNERDPKRNMP
jgi:hypothetical protein